MLQERRFTGEDSCRTEAPSAAWLSTGVEGEADEEDSTAPDAAICMPAVAGAAQDRLRISDPACQEAAMGRIILPTKVLSCFSHEALEPVFSFSCPFTIF